MWPPHMQSIPIHHIFPAVAMKNLAKLGYEETWERPSSWFLGTG
jgi:hypothetical protein